MHSFNRRLLDHKQLLLATCERFSWQIPLPSLGACVMAGAVRWAGGNAAPSPQQRQHKSADVASTQQKLAMQNDARVQQYPALQRLIQTLPPNDDRSAFPLGLYSAASGSDVASIALQSGANISGEEMGRFQGALSSTAYPEFEDEDRMYPAGVMEDIQMEVLRRNNISMPCKKNQRIYGTVYAVDKKRVWVDVGHSGLAQLGRSVRYPAHCKISSVYVYHLAPLSCSWAVLLLTDSAFRSCLSRTCSQSLGRQGLHDCMHMTSALGTVLCSAYKS